MLPNLCETTNVNSFFAVSFVDSKFTIFKPLKAAKAKSFSTVSVSISLYKSS